MAAIARAQLLAKFQDMVARKQPIVGGGAGTGLSAKAEEAGGIDLIIIYNSGRYRMAGRGSAAGLLAYGNANEIVKEMALEVLPVVKHTPVLAGVNGTDPFVLMPQFLGELKAMGFSGVQNFPTIGLFDGVMRQSFEETGMSYSLEVEMIALAHSLDLFTTPYVFNPDEARAMTKAGADIIVAHMGVTTGGAIGAKAAKTLDQCVRRDRRDRRRGARGARATSSSSATAGRSRCRRTPSTSSRARRIATASTARARWSGCRSRSRSSSRSRTSRRCRCQGLEGGTDGQRTTSSTPRMSRLRLRLGPAGADRGAGGERREASSRAASSTCRPARAIRRHNHPGAEEIIFVISGEGEQMVERPDGTPEVQKVGPGLHGLRAGEPLPLDAQHRQGADAALRRLFAGRSGAGAARPAGLPADPQGPVAFRFQPGRVRLYP